MPLAVPRAVIWWAPPPPTSRNAPSSSTICRHLHGRVEVEVASRITPRALRPNSSVGRHCRPGTPVDVLADVEAGLRIGGTPVTGAWMPITISVWLTPAVSVPPGSKRPGTSSGTMSRGGGRRRRRAQEESVTRGGRSRRRRWSATAVVWTSTVSSGRFGSHHRRHSAACIAGAGHPDSDRRRQRWRRRAATGSLARRRRRPDGAGSWPRPPGRGGGRGSRLAPWRLACPHGGSPLPTQRAVM